MNPSCQSDALARGFAVRPRAGRFVERTAGVIPCRRRFRRSLVIGFAVAAAAALPATTHAAGGLEPWRTAVHQARQLAENDAPRARDEMEKLQSGLPAGATDADRVLALNVLARTELYLALTAQAGKHAEMARNLAVKIDDRVGEAKADLTIALNTVNEGNFDPLIEVTTRSVAALEGANRPDLMAEALLRMAMMYRRFGHVADSVATCLRAMEVAQRSNDPLALTYAHQGLGISYQLSDHQQEARDNFQKMRQYARAAHSTLLEADAINDLGAVATDLGELRDGEALYREAISRYRSTGAPFSLCLGLIGLANNLRLQKHFHESLSLLDEVQAIYEHYENRLGIWFTLNWRSDDHLALGDKSAALAEAERAYALAKAIGFPLYISESASRMAGLMAGRGDFQRAYELERQAGEMTTKTAQRSVSARVSETARQYEVERRQRELNDLRQSNEQQAAELHERGLERRWLWTLLGGSAIVLVIGGYALIRLRRSRQAIGASREQLLRSQADLRQQTSMLESILRSIGDGVVVADEAGRFLLINPAAERLAALGRKEVGLPDWGEGFGFFLPDQKTLCPVADMPLARALRGESSDQVEEFVRSPQQPEGRWLSVTARPFSAGAAGVRGGVSVWTDITERKRREKELEESQQRFTAAFHASPSLMAVTRLADGMILEVNEAYSHLLGWTREESIGKTTDALGIWGDPEDRASFAAKLKELGEVKSFETRLRCKDGTLISCLDYARAFEFAGERCVLSVVYDITQRKLAEEKLRQRNRELALVNRIIAATSSEQDVVTVLNIACRELALAFDAPRASVALVDDDQSSATVVAEFRARDGPSALKATFSLVGNPVFQLMAVEKQPLVSEDAINDPRIELARETLRRLGVKSQVAWPLFVGNEPAGALVLATFQRRTFTADEVRLGSTVARELSALLEKVRLAEAHRRLTAAIEQSSESIIMTDVHGRIVYVNPAFERLAGYLRSEVLGQNPRILNSGQQDLSVYRELWARITAGEEWHGRLVNKRKDGSLYTEDVVITPVRDASGTIANFVAIKRDITRELRLEEQFLQAQKMEAFGQLAGGVAHDFNNILAVMLMHLNLMQLEEEDLSAKTRSSLKELEDDARRAANLTRQLLMFSRRQVMQKQRVDLGQILSSLLKMLRRILGEDIRFVRTEAEAPLPIEADPGMIEQVIMNLCVNARDAMPQGGQLTLGTELVVREGKAGTDPRRTGRFACLSVSDTGCGIDPATMKRIFEPFFTTKAVGKGTGLGLATVHGIVDQHHGWVEVESAPGKGTTFRVFLPAAGPAGSATDAAGPAGVRGGTEAILLVEDEAAVRELAAECLSHHGYQVVAVPNGVEALLKWEEHEHGFDLLLTDMIMPEGVSGLALAEQLARAKDSLKVIVTSGYSAELKASTSPFGGKLTYLAKPFDVPQLLRVVRECLDSG